MNLEITVSHSVRAWAVTVILVINVLITPHLRNGHLGKKPCLVHVSVRFHSIVRSQRRNGSGLRRPGVSYDRPDVLARRPTKKIFLMPLPCLNQFFFKLVTPSLVFFPVFLIMRFLRFFPCFTRIFSEGIQLFILLSGLWKMWSVLPPFVSRSSPSPFMYISLSVAYIRH